MMEWDPTQFFRTDHKPKVPYAILVLNQPINENAFDAIKQNACYILCADGGANRYYELMKTRGKVDTDLPSAIIGDLDSLLPHVHQHYESRNVPVIYDPDQYSTDFTKCLQYLRANATQIVNKHHHHHYHHQEGESEDSSSKDRDTRLDVLILGGLGGRVDQAFSQIHHLYAMTSHQHQRHDDKSTKEDTPRNTDDLYLISEESISFVLQPGRNTIHTPETKMMVKQQQSETELVATSSTADNNKNNNPDDTNDSKERKYHLEENVGIIPICGPSRITISGFEWDVSNWTTEIGGQISTSNHIRADVVAIETDRPVLFTVELAERFKKRIK